MGAACANAKIAQTVPLIKVLEEDQNKKEAEKVQMPSSRTSSREQNLTKLSTLSKQVSNISSDGMPPKKGTRTSITNGEDLIRKSQVHGKNPGLDLLLKQREFILEKFLSDIQVLEKSLMSDVIQMLRLFLSHLEQSYIYWTKVWLINANEYSLIVGFTNNVGETRKIRILFTKQIDQVGNLLDNYYYFSQLGSYKIYDYSFRLNKRHNNFYIFSEQEYCETCLETYQLDPGDVQPLLEYLLNTIYTMHSNYYIHSGIKSSNVYMIYNKSKVFKLDISFYAFKFVRRNFKNKIKDFRASQVNDLEDIAFLIINVFYKGSDVKTQFKQKNVDFSAIINALYQKQKNAIKHYIKDIVCLLHRNKQYIYDLKAEDYVQLLQSSSHPQLAEIIDGNIKDSNSILFDYQGSRVVFYNLTQIRNQKSYTQYQLVDLHDNPIDIIPGSAYISDNKFYFAYENMIAMFEIKLSTESIEDTIEILQISLKQYLAGIEQQKRERIDSAQSKYQLLINSHSPTPQLEDQFKFKEPQTEKLPNKNFHDRTYFSAQNVNDIFCKIDGDSRNSINGQQLYDFMQSQNEFIDSSLLQQLTPDRIQEIMTFFSSKWMTFKEFQQIFQFRSKSTLPIYRKAIKPLKQAEKVKTFVIIGNNVQYYDGEHLYIDENQMEIDYDLRRIVKTDNSVLYIGRQNGCLFLNNSQSFSTLTNVQINESFGFERINGMYIIKQQDELILYSVKQNSYIKLPIPGMTPDIYIIQKECFLLFMKGDKVHRIFLSMDKWCLTSFNILQTLFEHGRLDSKIKLKITGRQNSSNEDFVGQYSINKVHYPIQNQIPSLFRVLSVIKDQQNYNLIQRIVHGEFESFDDCYQVCKYLDPILLDFFLTIEYDGRLRLNYILQNSNFIEKKDCNFTLMKRCVKKLHEMRQQGIFVQDMHPNNILINSKSIIFTTLIYKSNLPSVYQEKQIPFMATLEYMEPRSFLAATQNMTQNQIFINPSKANVYNLGLVFLRLLSNYQIKNTKEQSLYLMEIAQALQQLSVPILKPLIEEMLKENEEQRSDSYALIQYLRKYEKQNQKEIYFAQQQLQFLEVQQNQILFGFANDTIYKYDQVFEIYSNIMLTNLEVLNILANDDGSLILLIKIIKDNIHQYKLLYIKLNSQLVSTPQQRKTSDNFQELVNFQQIVDQEEEEQRQSPTSNNQYIKLPHEILKEVTVPIFEGQNVNQCTCLINSDEIYFFGFGIANDVKRVGSRDCYLYFPKRKLFKKIGSRLTYYDSTVIDLGETCLLLENQAQNDYIRVQINTKSPFDCQEKTIKIKTKLRIDYFKCQQNIIAISENRSWLINVETFKAFELISESIPKTITPLQNTQNNTIITTEGIITLQFDGNILKVC